MELGCYFTQFSVKQDIIFNNCEEGSSMIVCLIISGHDFYCSRLKQGAITLQKIFNRL